MKIDTKAQSARVMFLMSSLRAGGGERVMIMLANELAQKGYLVDMLLLKQIGEYRSHLDPRIHVTNLNVWRILFAFPKVTMHMKRVQPTVAIATDEYTHLLLLGATYISRTKTKVILRIGNVFSELYARYDDIKHSVTFKLIKKFYRFADVLVANSQGVADDIIELASIDSSRVRVIYNPKPIEEIREDSKKLTGHDWLDKKDLPVVVGVGRLREQKNFPLLIRAFARAVKNMPARLVIVGGGRDEQALRSLASELSIEDSVLFTGYQDNPFAYMAKGDVYVLSSLWEGMPNALMEAMVCGVPVVAADCKSGPRELLAPGTDHAKRLEEGVEYAQFGILTAVRDEDALADALQKILTDETMRTRYATASFERAREFDSNSIMRQYEKVLGLKN